MCAIPTQIALAKSNVSPLRPAPSASIPKAAVLPLSTAAQLKMEDKQGMREPRPKMGDRQPMLEPPPPNRPDPWSLLEQVIAVLSPRLKAP